uniref:Flt3-interacting zinc finger protein 1 n=1 Tax=Macaca mulatta TaxID=9544 RepID=A0A5F8A9N4_MACMU
PRQCPCFCTECGKSFRYRSDLRRHFARHTALKPHACPRCGKGFKHSFNLANHLRSHTGERPYRCSACPKGFRDSTGLLHHQVVHTGEKPYCCLVCELRFSSRSSLGRHLKRQHRGVLPSPLQPGPGAEPGWTRQGSPASCGSEGRKSEGDGEPR